SRRPATTTRRSSRSSRPTRATSSSRSPRRRCTRRPSAFCTSATGGAGGSSLPAGVAESVLVRLHIIIHTDRGAPSEYDVPELERRLAEATRSWTDDLHDGLVEQCGEE